VSHFCHWHVSTFTKKIEVKSNKKKRQWTNCKTFMSVECLRRLSLVYHVKSDVGSKLIISRMIFKVLSKQQARSLYVKRCYCCKTSHFDFYFGCWMNLLANEMIIKFNKKTKKKLSTNSKTYVHSDLWSYFSFFFIVTSAMLFCFV
jgi:hypothetical protein